MGIFFANLIEEYVQDKKTLDENFALRVLDKILTEKQLTDLSSENHVYNFNNPIFGSGFAMEYSYPKGINVYIANSNKEVLDIIKTVTPILRVNMSELSEKELLLTLEYSYFIKIIMMLFHEVEHVAQNSKYNKIDTLEDVLVTLNLRLLRRLIDYELKPSESNKESQIEIRNKLRSYKSVEGLNYLEPIERFAHIKSTIDIPEIIRRLNTTDKIKESLIYFLDTCNMINHIYSYININRNTSPLEKYIEYMKKIGEYNLDRLTGEEIDKIINDYNNNLNLNQRVYYGFKITESEFDGIKKGKIKIL